MIERVRAILSSVSADSDVALACLITLGLCQDDSPEAVSLVVAQLGVEKHRWQTKIALLRIGSEAAVAALLLDLENQFDLSVAIDLYQRTDSRERALKIIKAHLLGASTHQVEEDLGPLLDLSDGLAAPFVEDVRVRDLLRERSFAEEGSGWRTGSKASVIRGLALFDPERAILAALKALENPNARDREHYPYLLVELVGDEAIKLLIGQALVEKSTPVLWAISRALDESGHKEAVTALLQSGDATQRLTGARIAERLAVTDTDVEMLELLAGDPDDDVVIAATRALTFQRAARNADELKRALRAEQDLSRRWVLIDAIMEVADPGDEHRPFSRWVSEVFGTSPSLEQEYIEENINKHRKKLRDEVTKRDKD